jgi:Mg-chelatase subunit ChlD
VFVEAIARETLPLTIVQPIWLFLLIPLGLSIWLWRLPTRLLVGLRLGALVLLILALSGLALLLPTRAGTVVVLADRSLSMPADCEAAQKLAIDLVQARMRGDDRLAVVSFGRTAAIDQVPQTGEFGGFVTHVGGDASNLAEGLNSALSLVPRDGSGRILVLSDGRWTGQDPTSVIPSAAARGVAIDYRPMQRSTVGDLAIARIDAPAVVSRGESFLITVWVHAPTAQEATFELKRGDARLSEGSKKLAAGLNRLTFRDRAGESGNQAYTVTVKGAAPDPVIENNTARLLVGVGGPRPILHVSPAAKSGLAKLLRKGGLDLVESEAKPELWTLESLAKYSAVVLENVPAEKVGTAGMETLAAWVRETGAGLMMTGGRNSYGPGGYYKSPLEPILPVSMELRNEHRKLSLAIVVTLDRSGSMAVPVAGGGVKMDLANQGTAQVLDLLGPMDEFGCIAVDTEPHTIAPLGPAADNGPTRKKILSIESMGGGIYIYVALEAAAQMITKAKSGTKHIILFADANDSEEPGRYIELMDKIKAAGITVSVIGLGTEKDKDADLLKDIAKRGGGRVFFSDNPAELPRLFAQDTFVVARNTFVDDPTRIKTTPGLAGLTDARFDMPEGLSLGGYNLCYLRPTATLGTVTLDEYKAPVAASWRAGAGRVVCYTGEADGKYAGDMARWDRVGDYFTSLARWTAGPSGPLGEGMLLTQEVKDGVNLVQLHLDPERKGDPVATLPPAVTLRSLNGEAPRSTITKLLWAGADTLAVEVPLSGTETTLTTVEAPGYGPVALPPVCLPYSPEFRPDHNERGLRTLEKLSRSTGGKERLEIASIWQDMPRQPRMISMTRWLLTAVLVLLLLEVLERRTGLLRAPRWLTWRRQKAEGRRQKADGRQMAEGGAAPLEEGPKPAEKTPAVSPPAPEESGVVEAMRKARQQMRRRTD